MASGWVLIFFLSISLSKTYSYTKNTQLHTHRHTDKHSNKSQGEKIFQETEMKFSVLINISLSCVCLSLDGICAYVCLCFNYAGFLCVNVFLHVLLKERDGGGG